MKLANYLRLSKADGDLGDNDKDESNSIENQRILLQNYINSQPDFPKEAVEYIDDGYTGTNFDRPAFKRMIEDAKQGKIDTILVKDLSRLGRNYIGVGDYMEQIFPMLNIRFIAVCSHYDSNDYIGDTTGLEMGIMNLVNMLYSRDISKKVTSSLRTKWKNGISTTAKVPFGYRKDPEQKGKWLLDDEAAYYVRLIFDRALSGCGRSEIVNYLNSEKIPTPGQYRLRNNETPCWKQKVSEQECLWESRMVGKILRDYAYTGALIQGKSIKTGVGSKTRRKVGKEDWIIIENVHPAIVTCEEFEKVQSTLRKNQNFQRKRDNGFALRGKLRCGNCGLSMVFCEGATTRFYCNHALASGKTSGCNRTKYEEEWINGIVLFSLNHQLSMLSTFADMLREKTSKIPKDIEKQKKKIMREKEVLQEKKIRLYERYAEGVITAGQYKADKASLAEQAALLQEQYEKLDAVGREESALLNEIETEQEKAGGAVSFEKLDRKAVDAFIDNVYVYGKDRVEIVFTFDDLIKRATEFLLSGNEVLDGAEGFLLSGNEMLVGEVKFPQSEIEMPIKEAVEI